MSTLKLAGMLLIVLSVVETLVMRFLIERNPKLGRMAPILYVSTAVMGLVGVGLLLFG
jgi:hypothetical protein